MFMSLSLSNSLLAFHHHSHHHLQCPSILHASCHHVSLCTPTRMPTSSGACVTAPFSSSSNYGACRQQRRSAARLLSALALINQTRFSSEMSLGRDSVAALCPSVSPLQQLAASATFATSTTSSQLSAFITLDVSRSLQRFLYRQYLCSAQRSTHKLRRPPRSQRRWQNFGCRRSYVSDLSLVQCPPDCLCRSAGSLHLPISRAGLARRPHGSLYSALFFIATHTAMPAGSPSDRRSTMASAASVASFLLQH